MNLDRIGPTIEAKLREYAALQLRFPEAPISHVYEGLIEFGKLGVVSRAQGARTSPQERWVAANEQTLREGAAIERALGSMEDRQRMVIERRYLWDWEWWRVAKAVQISERHAFNLRDQAFGVLATALGFWDGAKGGCVNAAGAAAT